MTTVGYGDVKPATDEGRVLAMVVMFVGIGFLTLLIGAAAERFVARDVEDEVAAVERELAGIDRHLLSELQAIRVQLDGLEAAIRSRR